MSRSFYFRFKNIYEIINGKIEQLPLKVKLISLGIITTTHFCYSIGTKGEKDIVIHKKYNFTRNGFTEFMVIDENGKHYNVNNSLWYWKWNSIEDWSLLENNTKINIIYYGWRIPILGIFPNIVYSRKIQKPIPGLFPNIVYSRKTQKDDFNEEEEKFNEEGNMVYNNDCHI
jgi:hypothetical protein